MAIWEEEPEDFHSQQLRAYGIKKNLNPVYDEENSKPATTLSTAVLIPETGMPVPAPKPAEAAPLRSVIKLNAPLERTVTSDPLSISRFAEEGLTTKINRKPVGTVSREHMPVDKVAREEDSFFPNMSRVDLSETVPSHHDELSQAKPKRSDSFSSLSSIKSFSKQLARRVSQDIRDQAEIIKMSKSERIEFRRSKAASLVGSPSTLTLNRGSYNADDAPIKQRPGSLTAGERFALGVSKMTDGLKARGRSGTNDSDMSFGDQAPIGTMNNCGRCDAPTWDQLTHGVCKDCYEQEANEAGEKTKAEYEGFFTDPRERSQGRSTWPDAQSAEADSGYIRLPGKKKLIRIRPTIYEDPGNPFADEMDDEDEPPSASWFSHKKPLLPRPERRGPTEEDAEDEPPSESWFSHARELCPRRDHSSGDDKASVRSNSEYDERRVQSVPSNEALTFPPKLPHLNSSAAAKINHRRSMSVAVSSASPTDANAEYIAPRQFWRQGSAPAVPQLKEPASREKDVRDTRFYGFYDDIMNGYKNRDSTI